MCQEILEYAGIRIGIGDWRPRFGRFYVSSFTGTARVNSGTATVVGNTEVGATASFVGLITFPMLWPNVVLNFTQFRKQQYRKLPIVAANQARLAS